MGWGWPLLAAVTVSGAALLGSGAILLLGARAQKATAWLLSFAIGALLGVATLGLLPEALASQPPERVMSLFLGGIFGFIALERALRWRHLHGEHQHRDAEHALARPTAPLLLWGDALHNLVDGLVLGISFQVSPEVGLLSTAAVFAHEVPQELGDFAVLLESGMARGRAFWLNYLSAAAVIPGALVSYAGGSRFTPLIGWLLPVAAGSFVYIALANLVPSLHHRRGRAVGVLQLLLILVGIWVVRLLGSLEG